MTAPESLTEAGVSPVLLAVGARIRETREQAGLTQLGLAEILDVTQTAVSYWEAGKRDPGIADLLRIAGALGVSASSLLPGEHHEPATPAPPGRYGRIEIPGYRENEGWISEETRFGLQVAVVRDKEGTETAAIGIGPLCRVVWLPVPGADPEQPLAIVAGGGDDDYDEIGPF